MRRDEDSGTRLPNTAHTSRSWSIHEIVGDFRLEDVWLLPIAGGAEDFPHVVRLIAASDFSDSSSRTVRTLFAIRWKLGRLLGWEGPGAGLGARVVSLRERLPVDLRAARSGPYFDALPFNPLYQLDDEFAAEIANQTVHGVLHIGWVPHDDGVHRAELAVYVKPNGALGTAYLAAIRPFRYLVVYPVLLREAGRAWRTWRAVEGGVPA